MPSFYNLTKHMIVSYPRFMQLFFFSFFLMIATFERIAKYHGFSLFFIFCQRMIEKSNVSNLKSSKSRALFTALLMKS